MKEQKVLFIAYYFPPLGGGGVQRTVKFCRYLPEFGWTPLILSAQASSALVRDPTLQAEVPANLTITRTPAWRLPAWLPYRLRRWLTRWLLLVDEQIGWYPFAVQAGPGLINQTQTAVIYSTAAPYTDHLIAARLKQQTGLPWVADFRDPWINNFSLSFPTRLHARLNESLEKTVITEADKVLVVSDPMRRDFIFCYADQPREKFEVLPNGFDPADFEGLTPAAGAAQRFTIVYTGSFYGEKQTPVKFLGAMRSCIQTERIRLEDLEIKFIGSTGKGLEDLLDRFGLREVTQVTGYLPHRESLRHLLSADILLLIIGSGPGSEVVYTGKIFEYLAARRPILAIVPPGVAADLIRESRAGVVADPDDEEAIAQAILSLYAHWSAGDLSINTNESVIARYNRKNLTARLAGILSELTDQSAQA